MIKGGVFTGKVSGGGCLEGEVTLLLRVRHRLAAEPAVITLSHLNTLVCLDRWLENLQGTAELETGRLLEGLCGPDELWICPKLLVENT